MQLEMVVYFKIQIAPRSGNSFTLTNISFKEVLIGNHATTNFFGDDLLTNGDFKVLHQNGLVLIWIIITGGKLVADF